MDLDKTTTDQDVDAKTRESDIEASLETPIEKTATERAMEFPDGGAKAWSVAIGAAGVLFCTFGYANAFGCVLSPQNLCYTS